MTKTKSTKRALLLSALSLLMCVSMLIGSTFAWFTDSATSANNKIVAGNLDVELHMWNGTAYEDISATSAPIFGTGSVAQNNNAQTLWEPGKTQVAYLAIKNNGNLDLKYTVGLNVQNVSKDLYEVMEYAIVPDADANNKVTAWNGGNSVVLGTQSVSGDVELKVGETHYFALAIHMDELAGNEYQDGEVNFDLTVLATQLASESDSFGNDYDANAPFSVWDGIVPTEMPESLVVDGETLTVHVKDAAAFAYLSTLTARWAELYTDGNGRALTNYIHGAGGDYYYSGKWTIVLDADIDLNNNTIAPVQFRVGEAGGYPTFDGNNHTIKNAKIVTDATTENAAGLFIADQCLLKNLKLDNIHVTGSNVGNSTAGVLAGTANIDQGVKNITITNSSVTGGKYTGGVIGYGYTDVLNCTLTNVTVKGGYKLGGVIGYICANDDDTGDVTGNTLTDCTVDGIGGGVFAGGKDEYIIGKLVGNYDCDGTCNNNTVTGMTSSATKAIGKIEAGRTVTQ